MAFVSPVPLLTVGNGRARSSTTAPARPVAVLDKPASNSHLKVVSANIFRDFLTRRSVHTIVHYMREMRDSASANWLLKFERFEVREQNDMFHDGDEFLLAMMGAPLVKGHYVRKIPRAYITRKYPFTIKPARIADSILSSRNQLASEWAVDLRCVEADNLELKRMSFERILEKDQRVLDSRRNLVFDCDVFANDQSPLRAKNYSKMIVLVTQHAIMRLMPYLRDTSNHDYMYMMNYVSRYGPLSDGAAFIEELIAQPPVDRTNPMYRVEPRSLAMQVLDLRQIIAKEWIEVMSGIPDEQLRLKRQFLERSAKLQFSTDE